MIIGSSAYRVFVTVVGAVMKVFQPQQTFLLKNEQPSELKVSGVFKTLASVFSPGTEYDLYRKPTKNHKFVVIGETGSGKSTLINLMCNFFRGGTLDRINILIPTAYYEGNQPDSDTRNEADAKDTTRSQTIKCKEYNFQVEGKTMTAVDTPGIADTNGTHQDDKNINEVLRMCAESTQLQAIVFVFNGTNIRFNNTMMTVLTRFRNTLPNKVLDNIVVVFTNCTKLSSRLQPEAIEKVLFKGGRKLQKIFYMQNSAFSQNPDTLKDHECREEILHDWNRSLRCLREMFEYIQGLTPVGCREFAKLKDTRDKLKSKMGGLLAEINAMDQTRQMIEAAEERRKRAGKDEAAFRNFVSTEYVDVWKQVPTAYHNTVCTLHKQVCHQHCGLNKATGVGAPELAGCIAFQGTDTCQTCPGAKCSRAHHYHDNNMWVKESNPVTKILEDIKKKHDEALRQGEQASKSIVTAGDALSQLDAALNKRMGDVRRLCRELKSVCTGFNLAAELGTTVEEWEKQLLTLTSLETRKALQERIRVMEIFVKGLNEEKAFS